MLLLPDIRFPLPPPSDRRPFPDSRYSRILNSHSFPQFKFASNPTTRRRAVFAFNSRLAHNAPLLRQALALRRRCARILGYPTWADYVVEVNLAKTPERVFEVCVVSFRFILATD